VKQNQQPDFFALLATVVGQVGCVVILLVGLALGAGLLLDKFLQTKAIFTVILMLGSVPVALFVTMRISMAAAARAQQLMKADKTEEDIEA
jgi:F0F1-type ATP synthase assembly protein I